MRQLMVLLCCICVFAVAPAYAKDEGPKQAAVVSAHPIATKAGQDILAKGGNAFDAAIAVSATLAVVEPFGSGIGGGGFWLYYDAGTKQYKMLDARETAPSDTHRDMYLDQAGNPIPKASTDGPLSAGIPGLPAAFVDISKSHGTLPLKDVFAPAIKAAQEGFAVDARYVEGARFKKDLLSKYPETASIFLDKNNVPQEGWVLQQPDLAKTLTAIAEKGKAGFYGGDVADKMVAGVIANGGIWRAEDLRNYKTVLRDPVISQYKDTKIVAASLPSSGGLVLAGTFNVLAEKQYDEHNEIKKKHLLIEAMRRSYQDRAVYMGDPDFVDVPVKKLLHPDYAAQQSASIDMDKATPSKSLSPVEPETGKGTETTHFAVMDKDGNRVAVTQSINFWFGSGFVPKGTGVLLNNEMDDFSIKKGVENGYGLVGGKTNEIQPNKRMLSSMTPTFLENDKGLAIIGTPGGSRIISMNLLAALHWLDGKTAKDMVTLPRYHHQFHPDVVLHEKDAFTDAEKKALTDMGHILKESKMPYGNMQVITWDKQTNAVTTGSDPRGHGSGHVY